MIDGVRADESDDGPLLVSDLLAALPDARHRRALVLMLIGLEQDEQSLRPPPTPDELLARRDAAIRAALARNYPGQLSTVAAKSLAADLRLAASLKAPPVSEALKAAKAILALNQNRPVGWRQLDRIAAGFRR